MNSRSFLPRSLLAAILIHLVLLSSTWAVFYFSLASVEMTEGPTLEMGMSWEVESSSKPSVPSEQIKKSSKSSQTKTVKNADRPQKPSIEDAGVPDTTPGRNSPSIPGEGPTATEIQKYLSKVRLNLSSAIEVAVNDHTPASSVVLKITLSPTAQVLQQTIEKPSGSNEVDQAVIRAFETLLPLPAFPAAWNQSGSMQNLIVRFPVEVHPRKNR